MNVGGSMILVSCDSFDFILRIAGYLFGALQWVIPFILIAFITYDIVMAFISADEKKTKEALGRSAKRLIYAVILFLLPMLIKLIFGVVDRANVKGYGGNDNSAKSWISCFNEYFN